MLYLYCYYCYYFYYYYCYYFKTLFKENSTNALQLSQKAAIMELQQYSSHFVDFDVLNFNLSCSTVFGNLLLLQCLTYT